MIQNSTLKALKHMGLGDTAKYLKTKQQQRNDISVLKF